MPLRDLPSKLKLTESSTLDVLLEYSLWLIGCLFAVIILSSVFLSGAAIAELPAGPDFPQLGQLPTLSSIIGY